MNATRLTSAVDIAADRAEGYTWTDNGVGDTDVPMVRHEGSIPGFRAMY